MESLKLSSIYFCMKFSVKQYFLCSASKGLLFQIQPEEDYMFPFSLKTFLFSPGRHACHWETVI